MKILVLDNYDSFTYNLVHLVEKVTGLSVDVHRNDRISLPAIDAYDRIILSPGPGLPKDAGIMPELLKRYHLHKSIFGVCLGMQALALANGADVVCGPEPVHGRLSSVSHTGHRLFDGIPSGQTRLLGAYTLRKVPCIVDMCSM